VELIRAARSARADLLVVGTHGRTGLRHALLGSVAEKVVRKAPCPVLVVRPPEQGFELP
jgi:nucleotide-binding universal stress UspA family protein